MTTRSLAQAVVDVVAAGSGPLDASGAELRRDAATVGADRRKATARRSTVERSAFGVQRSAFVVNVVPSSNRSRLRSAVTRKVLVRSGALA